MPAQVIFHPPHCIAIDVDDTLIGRDGLDLGVVAFIEAKREEGMEVMLWSMRGRAYARAVAEKHRVAHLFDAIISKPGWILDDQGWQWVAKTRVVPLDMARGEGDGL